MFHEQNVTRLLDYFKFMVNSTDEVLKENGFISHNDRLINTIHSTNTKHRHVITAIRDFTTSYYKITISVKSKGDSNLLAEIGTYVFFNIELIEDNLVSYYPAWGNTTLRASRKDTSLILKTIGDDTLCTSNHLINDFNDEAEIFQSSLISSVPDYYVQCAIDMINVLTGTTMYDKMLLIYNLPTIEFDIPRIPYDLHL